ncbi:hypothetical protein GWK47_023227 [Chionoecetes opilio]|uniref:Uncharacterized protein n=1 Tax=Chionoecetes opilio TaxID=41210 RepID=A0A8J4XN32_CHIOP|nr:hypothetical protein GWK47_023227 [Chionoecetes opilio]
MLAGTHALVEHTYIARLLLQSYPEAPSWYIMREPLMTGALQCYFRRHTPWKYKFDDSFRRLVEGGLFQQWTKEEMTQFNDRGGKGSGQAVGSDPRRGSGEGPAPPLTLLHLQGAFYVLGIVWVAGGGVLLMEILTHRHQTSRGRYS